MKGMLGEYGEVWYNPKCPANILSFSLLCATYHISFDSTKENTFLVYKPDGTILHFPLNSNGLYCHDFRNPNHVTKPCLLGVPIKLHITLLTKKESEKAGFSGAQIKRAQMARRMVYASGFPTELTLQCMMNTGQIRNCPIAAKDMQNSELIFGRDESISKGKTTRSCTIM